MEKILSPEAKHWLDTHGGKDEKEVQWEIDEHGREVKFVLMDDGHGKKEKVYF